MSVSPCPYPRCQGPDRNATLTAHGICQWCRPRVERDLRAAPGMYVKLHLGLAPSDGPTEKVSGTKTPAPPLRLAMIAAGTTYVRVLALWVALVRVAADLSEPPAGRTREGWSIAHNVDLLLPRLEQACQVSPHSAVDLSTTALLSRRLLKLTRLTHHLAAPCPDCDLLALYREDGAAYVRCAACGAEWAEELYQSLARVIAAEYDV